MAGQQFQYDDSGNTFFYFLTSFVGLIVIPATYYLWPRDQHAGERPCPGPGLRRRLPPWASPPLPLLLPSPPSSASAGGALRSPAPRHSRAVLCRAVPPAGPGPSRAPLSRTTPPCLGCPAGPAGSPAERDPGGCRFWGSPGSC